MRRMRGKLSRLICLVLLCGVFSSNTPALSGYSLTLGAHAENIENTPAEDAATILRDVPEPVTPAELPEPVESEKFEEPLAALASEPEVSETPLEAATPDTPETEVPLETAAPETAETEMPLETATPEPERTPDPVYDNRISGRLWIDINLDGAYDEGESPAANYPVGLYLKDSPSAAVQSTSTNSDGNYSFANLSPGTYVVAIGPATVNGQKYSLFLGGRKNDNQFALAEGRQTAEDEDDVLAVSREITVGADSVIRGINGCICLPQSPAPRMLTFNFSLYIQIVDADGLPVDGIKWQIGKHTGLQTSPVFQYIYTAKTGADGIINYATVESISAPGEVLALTLYITFPTEAVTVYGKGIRLYKSSSSGSILTSPIDQNYALDASKILSFGHTGTDSNGQLTAEYHLGSPLILTINGYWQMPIVTTGAARNITRTGATIEGDYNFNTTASVAAGCYFEYGTAPDLTGALQAAWTPTGKTGTASADLTGLLPNTTYYYRIRARNEKGDAAGAIASFKTLREVNVSFDLMDGSPLQSAPYLYTDAFQSLPSWASAYQDPTWPTYVFAGWNTEPNGSGTDVTGESIVGDVFPGTSGTLYARWEPQEYEITVKHRLRNGNNLPGIADEKTALKHGTAFAPTVPTVHGYLLVGWTLDGVKQNEATPGMTVPPHDTEIILIYGYDRNGNNVEDFIVTRVYESSGGGAVGETSPVIVDVGDIFADAAPDIADYLYDYYIIDGTPSASNAVPAIEMTANRGDFTIIYIYNPNSLNWGELDPGMKGMNLDFGQRRLPMGTIYFEGNAENHTIRITDSRMEPTSWFVNVGLTKFSGEDGSSFIGTITMKNPMYEQGGLTVSDTITVLGDGYQQRIITAADGLSGTFDITWSGSDITLYIDEAGAANIAPTAYTAQLTWTITDAP